MTASAGGLSATVGLIARDRQLIGRTRQAALELGIDLHVLAVPSGLGDLIASAARCDVVTFESSALSAAQGEILQAAGVTLRPGLRAAELADNPATARHVFRECGFDVTPISAIGAIDAPWPRRGNRATGRRSPPAVRWAGELNVVIARRPSGFRVIYPVVDTGGGGRFHPYSPVLAASRASTVERAVKAAVSITDGIDATGIITVEFVLDNEGRALVNSVQLGPHPRPQPISDPANSSRFEDHLCAILDWPLRPPTIGTPARTSFRA